MAHGIKTPLTTILLAAQKISSVCPELAQKDNVLKYSRSIEDEANRLHKITDGFMRLVQSEAPRRESVDALPYLQGLVEEKRGMLPVGASIDLRADENLPRLWIDQQQMKTALVNVLDNAVDAIKEGGRIEVTARLAERIRAEHVEKSVEIRIIDNGCGIKTTYMRQLFKPFASFRPGGTGLGLVYSKKIIEEHGGKIDIQSKEDHGTTVTIFLQAGTS
jgi:signal transduction histidine kinase